MYGNRNRSYARSLVLVFLPLLLLLPAVLSAESLSGAANPFARVQGPEDGDVPLPAFTGALGEVDAGAKGELSAHLDATGAAGAQAWRSLSATGELTYPATPGSGGSESDAAVLAILGSGDYRLDVSRPSGVESTRIQAATGVVVGAILDADGSRRFLPRITAAYGLLDFPLLDAAGFPGSGSALLDRGNLSIGGSRLHRITYERPLLEGGSAARSPILVTDFYFDPATHLLVKSAEEIEPPTPSGMGFRGLFLQVTTYGDYRKADGVLLPFRITRTLNGEPMWSLQLDQVTLGQSADASMFSIQGGAR